MKQELRKHFRKLDFPGGYGSRGFKRFQNLPLLLGDLDDPNLSTGTDGSDVFGGGSHGDPAGSIPRMEMRLP